MNEITFNTGTASQVLAGMAHAAAHLVEGQTIDQATDQDLIVMAQGAGDVLGYIAATSDLHGGFVVWEHVVAPECQNRGIGRRLLLEVARRSAPMAKITIDPSGPFEIGRVSAYYARLGFPTTPEDAFKVSVPAHRVVDAIGEQLEEHTTIGTIIRRKSTGIVTVRPDDLISDALALIVDKKIGSVVVSTDGVAIDGILSERDLLIGLRTQGADVLHGAVADHMTTDFVTTDVTTLIADVMEIATVQRLRHLPVTEDGKLIGIVSVGDLLVFRMREHDMRREVLPLR